MGHSHPPAAAFAAWEQDLGGDHVIRDPAVLAARSRATYHTDNQILGILRPGCLEEVQACVRTASRHRVALYPVSTGRNWGYGSAAPAGAGCVLVDLGRLDEISGYDPDLGCVTVGAGVTYARLHAFLQSRGGDFWVDAVGASGRCSPVGNLLERGSGHGPYADHFAHCCALEIVLSDGECIHTGFGRFANARAAHVHRWGVGPYLDGLFTQSSLGIVTRATLWLLPAPEAFEAFFFHIDDDAGLGPAIDALRPLRLRGILRSALHIGNGYRLLSSVMQYPWQETGGRTPLTGEPLARALRRCGLSAWGGAGGLYGTRAEVADARRRIRRALTGRVTELRFLGARTLAVAERLQRPLSVLMRRDLGTTLTMLRPVYDMMKGLPTDRYLATAYWRKRTPIPADMDPDRDGCGLIWCSPVVPLDGRQVQAVIRLAADILLARGFEPGVTVTLLTERAVEIIISITYDRAVDGEDARASSAHDALLSALMAAGYYPYRVGTHAMGALPSGEASHARLLDSLKGALDPRRILSPGRYL